MKKNTLHRIALATPLMLFVLIAGGTIVLLALFLHATWNTVNTAETLAVLRQEVVAESLNRVRFDRVVQDIKEKTAERKIDWGTLHDPF